MHTKETVQLLDIYLEGDSSAIFIPSLHAHTHKREDDSLKEIMHPPSLPIPLYLTLAKERTFTD